MITANISGSSQGDMHTNRFGASWFTMDASVGKTFLNKSLTVSRAAHHQQQLQPRKSGYKGTSAAEAEMKRL